MNNRYIHQANYDNQIKSGPDIHHQHHHQNLSNINLASNSNISSHLSSNISPNNYHNNSTIQNSESSDDKGEPMSPRIMSDEEQQLATKLKETYKNIVNFEEIVQKNCIEITIKINQLSDGGFDKNSQKTSELSNDLWTIYHHNLSLLNNYYDFLVTALKPSSNQTQFKTGKNIVEIYKIPRRMWVYGVVGFLEVLKNIMTIFQDHEISSCFISYCFSIISNLTDPILEMEGWWSEKLGDLSRMAIALYCSKFIDWKISAEYWYSISMKLLYGHGKIYYHMCTVQQDNLDALVNIGKSVTCRDPFVPTQHYLRLVVENICTQRNILPPLELPIIDFIKIHKVLLSIYNNSNNNNNSNSNNNNNNNSNTNNTINTNSNSLNNNINNINSSNNNNTKFDIDHIHNTQIQYGIDLVTRYGLTFGSDYDGYNFFTREFYTPPGMNINDGPQNLPHNSQQSINSVEKINFWFTKGSLFAIANVNHLIGFGDAKNPFAKLFQLPEALKERKDKKDRKRKSKINDDEYNNTSSTFPISNGVDGQSIVAAELNPTDWFYCLQFINKSVLELSCRILNHYLIGPKQASTGHVIVWLYFLIAVGEATNKFPNSKPMFTWIFKKLFPWESFINYLNSLLYFTKNSPNLREIVSNYVFHIPDYISHLNNHEYLPEVWKCWGTLWFDQIMEKVDYRDSIEAGVENCNLFDLPISGMCSVFTDNDRKLKSKMAAENETRVVRIILLSRIIADKYPEYGLIRTINEFKYDEYIYKTSDSPKSKDYFSYMENFLFNDGRFVQNSLLQTISSNNLARRDNFTPQQKDSSWFGDSGSGTEFGTGMNMNSELGDDIIEVDELDGYADSEFEEEEEEEEEEDEEVEFEQANQYYYPNQINSNDDEVIEGNFGDHMDTNVTYITLDTNIWLKHCGRVFKCVRDGVFKVSIPLIVFQELRALRKSAEATIADAATRSVIIIRELYLTREILPLRFDGTVASDINETTEFENNSNWRSSVDETILNAVNEHDEIGKKLMKGLNIPVSKFKIKEYKPLKQQDFIILNAKQAKTFRYCILVTDDRNMRLRAKTHGLACFQSKWLFNSIDYMFPYKCVD